MAKRTKFIDVFIIDAKNMKVEQKTIEDNIKTFYDIINTDSVEIIARKINGKITQIICDEEGKLKEHQFISASSNDFRETLVGNLIVKSDDPIIPMIVAKYGMLVYSFK